MGLPFDVGWFGGVNVDNVDIIVPLVVSGRANTKEFLESNKTPRGGVWWLGVAGANRTSASKRGFC